jgi:hypothetical protein
MTDKCSSAATEQPRGMEPILNSLMQATLDVTTTSRPALRKRFEVILRGQVRDAAQAAWKCKANPRAVVPEDCNWPHCGCDPHAGRVMQGLIENGWESPSMIAEREREREAAQPPAAPVETCPYAIDGCVLEKQEVGPCLCANPVRCSSADTEVDDAEIEALERTVEAMHSMIEQLHAENVALRDAVPQEARKPADIKSIAAIIDPSAWKMEDGFIVEQSHSDESIRKAEAILESLRVGDLVDALRTIGELEPLRQVGDGTYDFAPRLGAAQSCALARKVLGISSSVTRPHEKSGGTELPSQEQT